MSGHFIEKCGYCDAVIMQCRCPGPKQVTWGICKKCLAKSNRGGAQDNKPLKSDGVSDPPCPVCGEMDKHSSDCGFI